MESQREEAALRVAAGVIFRGRSVLVCRRKLGGAHPGKWEFPGGKLEAGESPADCVRRELREELGITAEPGREICHTRHIYPQGPTCDLVFVHVRHYDGTPVNNCFAEIRWAEPRELAALDFLEADRAFVGMLQDGTFAVA